MPLVRVPCKCTIKTIPGQINADGSRGRPFLAKSCNGSGGGCKSGPCGGSGQQSCGGGTVLDTETGEVFVTLTSQTESAAVQAYLAGFRSDDIHTTVYPGGPRRHHHHHRYY